MNRYIIRYLKMSSLISVAADSPRESPVLPDDCNLLLYCYYPVCVCWVTRGDCPLECAVTPEAAKEFIQYLEWLIECKIRNDLPNWQTQYRKHLIQLLTNNSIPSNLYQPPPPPPAPPNATITKGGW